MRKYVIIGFDNEYRTFVKTEEELREWAEEVRQRKPTRCNTGFHRKRVDSRPYII